MKVRTKEKEKNRMENGVIGIETDGEQNENYLFTLLFFLFLCVKQRLKSEGGLFLFRSTSKRKLFSITLLFHSPSGLTKNSLKFFVLQFIRLLAVNFLLNFRQRCNDLDEILILSLAL